MGRQTGFYLSKQTKERFLGFVLSKGYMIISEKYNKDNGWHSFTYRDNNCKYDSNWMLIFYKDSHGSLFESTIQKGRVDRLISPIVEFTDTTIFEDDHTIKKGRIWAGSNINFPDERAHMEFISDYNKLLRWIRKNIPRQEYFDGFRTSVDYIDNEIKDKYEFRYNFI